MYFQTKANLLTTEFKKVSETTNKLETDAVDFSSLFDNGPSRSSRVGDVGVELFYENEYKHMLEQRPNGEEEKSKN